jgi:hypothetical protein
MDDLRVLLGKLGFTTGDLLNSGNVYCGRQRPSSSRRDCARRSQSSWVSTR